MAVLTITLLLANVVLVAAAIVKIKNLEQKISHDIDLVNTKVENVRMRHKQDISELEECMVVKLDKSSSVNETLSDLIAAVECVTDEVEQLQEEVNAGLIECKADIKNQVEKSTENIFWRIVSTPMKVTDK